MDMNYNQLSMKDRREKYSIKIRRANLRKKFNLRRKEIMASQTNSLSDAETSLLYLHLENLKDFNSSEKKFSLPGIKKSIISIYDLLEEHDYSSVILREACSKQIYITLGKVLKTKVFPSIKLFKMATKILDFIFQESSQAAMYMITETQLIRNIKEQILRHEDITIQIELIELLISIAIHGGRTTEKLSWIVQNDLEKVYEKYKGISSTEDKDLIDYGRSATALYQIVAQNTSKIEPQNNELDIENIELNFLLAFSSFEYFEIDDEEVRINILDTWIELGKVIVYESDANLQHIEEERYIQRFVKKASQMGIESRYVERLFKMISCFMENCEIENEFIFENFLNNEELLFSLKEVLENSKSVDILSSAVSCVSNLFYLSKAPNYCKKLSKGFKLKNIIQKMLVEDQSDQELKEYSFDLLHNFSLGCNKKELLEFLEIVDGSSSFFDFILIKFPGEGCSTGCLESAINFINSVLSLVASTEKEVVEIMRSCMEFQRKLEELVSKEKNLNDVERKSVVEELVQTIERYDLLDIDNQDE